MIRIRGWSEKFECAESRKRGELRWYSCPVGLTSTGYMILAGTEGGFAAFGIFQAICQLHANKSPREQRLEGIVSRSDGSPLSLEMVRVHLRASKEQLDAALKILTSEGVGWIAYDAKDSQATPAPRPSNAQETPKRRPRDARHSTVQYNTVQHTLTPSDADAGLCVSIIEEVSEAYGSPSSRVSSEAKRELWEANKTQAFTDDDLTLVARFIRKHRAGKFGNNAPKIAQSASRAIAGFVELLARAEAHKAEVEPYKAPPPMKTVDPPEDLTPEARAEIKAEIERFKTRIKRPTAKTKKKDAKNP